MESLLSSTEETVHSILPRATNQSVVSSTNNNNQLGSLAAGVWAAANASSTNIGPLTTTFTPPSDCTSITFANIHWTLGWGISTDVTAAWQVFPSNYTTEWESCYPPRFATLNASWYSPGICPQSWRAFSLPSETQSVSDGGDGTEMRAACCPPGFFHVNNLVLPSVNCFSSLQTGTMAILTDGDARTTKTESLSQGSVFAVPVEIRWQSTDTITPSSVEVTAATSASNRGSNRGSSGGGSSSFMSPGSIIGLAVGLPLLIIILLLASFCIHLQRKRRREKDKRIELPDSRTAEKEGDIELSGVGLPPRELDSNAIAELSQQTDIFELEGTPRSEVLTELEGSLVPEHENSTKMRDEKAGDASRS